MAKKVVLCRTGDSGN